jgi:hypothetical protein
VKINGDKSSKVFNKNEKISGSDIGESIELRVVPEPFIYLKNTSYGI